MAADLRRARLGLARFGLYVFANFLVFAYMCCLIYIYNQTTHTIYTIILSIQSWGSPNTKSPRGNLVMAMFIVRIMISGVALLHFTGQHVTKDATSGCPTVVFLQGGGVLQLFSNYSKMVQQSFTNPAPAHEIIQHLFNNDSTIINRCSNSVINRC